MTNYRRDILSAEQVARLIAPHPQDVTGWPLLLRRLADSHEELRARVKELNDELDAAVTFYCSKLAEQAALLKAAQEGVNEQRPEDLADVGGNLP